jgi:hypothetical protein
MLFKCGGNKERERKEISLIFGNARSFTGVQSNDELARVPYAHISILWMANRDGVCRDAHHWMPFKRGMGISKDRYLVDPASSHMLVSK